MNAHARPERGSVNGNMKRNVMSARESVTSETRNVRPNVMQRIRLGRRTVSLS